MKLKDFCGSVWIFATLATSMLGSDVSGFELPSASKQCLDRREALTKAARFLTSTLVTPIPVRADDSVGDSEGFKAYRIIPDSSATLSPDLVAIEVRKTAFAAVMESNIASQRLAETTPLEEAGAF